VFERLIRCAPALLGCFLALGASDAPAGDTETAAPAGRPADIELRKTFRFVRGGSRRVSPVDARGGGDGAAAAEDPSAAPPPHLEGVAAALGERLHSSGTLHLPGVGGAGIVLEGAGTPILETAAGRRLIIDRGGTVPRAVGDEISRRWPDYLLVQPPAGAGLREVVGSVLDAAGYASVLRAAPLVFGRGVTVRVTPDYVVLRGEGDLLAGDVRAISIVNPADALPPELRELAGEQRVRIVELTPEGEPAGPDRAPWRDAAGRVTTVETPGVAAIIEEIALSLGCSVERRVPLPAAAGEPSASADLRVTRDGRTVLVFGKSSPPSEVPGVGQGEAAIQVRSAADLPAAIGALLRLLELPAIGPTVELFRVAPPGAARRFVISVPGWLAEAGGRRLLITGGSPPPLLRLYLTREGIDLFEYRTRDGR
jgi:hypothetical protein